MSRYAGWFLIVGLTLLVAVALWIAADAESANKQQIRSVVCEVFGSRCGPALRVAMCETGGTLNPHSRGAAGERGLFQIHPIHFKWVRESLLWQPRYNARVAFLLSRGGRDWGAWTCRP